MADVLLTHVFNQQPDERFPPCVVPTCLEQEAWDLLKDKIHSKSTERKVWTKIANSISPPMTRAGTLMGLSICAAARRACVRVALQACATRPGEPLRRFRCLGGSDCSRAFTSPSGITRRLPKKSSSTWTTSQLHTNVGLDRLAAQCRLNQVQPDLHAARKARVPIAGRMDKAKKAEKRRAT